jgi:hypothetical protein
MRRLLLLLLLIAACTGAAEEPTTSAPLAEPSATTTSTQPPTTTTSAPTTATDECVDRDGDGVLRNQRGFVCPPHLTTYISQASGTMQMADIHLPGTYTLRTFAPKVRFTRTERFTTWGENGDWVGFDLDVPPHPADIPDQQVFSVADHEAAARIPDLVPWNHPDGWQWVTDLTSTETEIGGHPATVTRFLASCPEESVPDQTWPRCSFDEQGAFGWFGWRVFDEQWTAVVTVDLPSGPFTIIAYDTLGERGYWADVVQPILDTIEFLEP